jgi:hypothetical protein
MVIDNPMELFRYIGIIKGRIKGENGQLKKTPEPYNLLDDQCNNDNRVYAELVECVKG